MSSVFVNKRINIIINYVLSIYQSTEKQSCLSEIQGAEQDIKNRSKVISSMGLTWDEKELRVEVYDTWEGEDGFITTLVFSGDSFLEKSTFEVIGGQVRIGDSYIPKFFYSQDCYIGTTLKAMNTGRFIPMNFSAEEVSNGLYVSKQVVLDKLYKIKSKKRTSVIAWHSQLKGKKGFKVTKGCITPLYPLWAIEFISNDGESYQKNNLAYDTAIPNNTKSLTVTNYVDNDWTLF
jgi:hypothetical protein